MDKQDLAKIEEQAAEWFATMRGPQAGQQKVHFEAWRDRDVRHREAYAYIREIFDKGIVLRGSAQYGPTRKRRSFITPRKVLVPAAIAASLAVAVVMGLAASPISPWSSNDERLEDMTLETPPRAIRTFALPGGGALVLDQASKAIVSRGEQGARIELVAGRMQLQAMGSEESYTIAVGPNAIIARSGVLDVNLGAQEDPAVRLYSGHAEARPLLQNAAYVVQGRSLPSGRPLRLIRGTIFEARENFVANERDWPSGWAQYRTIPLARLIGIANRYAAKPIVLDDPVIGTQAVSGRFRFNDASSVARNLAAIFDLKVTEKSDGLHLQPR